MVADFNRRAEVLDLLTSDLSFNGAFFHTTLPLAEGTDVKIDLKGLKGMGFPEKVKAIFDKGSSRLGLGIDGTRRFFKKGDTI